MISNVSIFIDPLYLREKGAPIRISAWEEMAKELCKYKKGDMLHVVANVRPGQYKISDDKNIDVLEATVRVFLGENQAQDLKRGIYNTLRTFDGVVSDILVPVNSDTGDDSEEFYIDLS